MSDDIPYMDPTSHDMRVGSMDSIVTTIHRCIEESRDGDNVALKINAMMSILFNIATMLNEMDKNMEKGFKDISNDMNELKKFFGVESEATRKRVDDLDNRIDTRTREAREDRDRKHQELKKDNSRREEDLKKQMQILLERLPPR